VSLSDCRWVSEWVDILQVRRWESGTSRLNSASIDFISYIKISCCWLSAAWRTCLALSYCRQVTQKVTVMLKYVCVSVCHLTGLSRKTENVEAWGVAVESGDGTVRRSTGVLSVSSSGAGWFNSVSETMSLLQFVGCNLSVIGSVTRIAIDFEKFLEE